MDIQPSNQPKSEFPPQNDNTKTTFPSQPPEGMQPTTPPLTEPPKPTRRIRPIFWILLAVVVLLAGAAALYYFLVFSKQSPAQPDASNQGGVNQTKSLSAAEVITLVKAKLVDAKTEKSENEPPYIVEPDHKPSGYDFYTTTGRSGKTEHYVYVTGTAERADRDLTTMKQALLDNDFVAADTETYDYAKRFSEPAMESGVVYQSDKVVCLLNRVPPINDTTAPAPDATWLSCADKSDYEKSAKTIQPFYQALKAAGQSGGQLVVTVPSIKDSQTEGYKLAEGALSGYGDMSGAAALYYQAPDGVWRFFRAGQDSPACTDYNSDELKKAFVGEPCYDVAADKISTVKL